MKLLIKLLRAAHCQSTHHYFAVDALSLVSTAKGKQLCQVLLHYHQDYLRGAEAPDTEFRDFRNHVLHVQDNHWGGAPQAAEKWYRTLIETMEAGKWADASFAAGVLSHYFTDPVMPLNTAQSPRQAAYHRPLEWSVYQAYGTIHRGWKADGSPSQAILKGPRWLGRSITQGATIANQYYDELLDQYDLAAGRRNPSDGLNDRCIEIFSKLFSVTIPGLSQVIEQAAAEARCDIPAGKLGRTGLMAVTEAPMGWRLRQAGAVKERAVINAIINEYQSIAEVKANVPYEVALVRMERNVDRIAENASDQERMRRAVRRSDVVRLVSNSPPKEKEPARPPKSKRSKSQLALMRKGDRKPVADSEPSAKAERVQLADVKSPVKQAAKRVATPRKPLENAPSQKQPVQKPQQRLRKAASRNPAREVSRPQPRPVATRPVATRPVATSPVATKSPQPKHLAIAGRIDPAQANPVQADRARRVESPKRKSNSPKRITQLNPSEAPSTIPMDAHERLCYLFEQAIEARRKDKRRRLTQRQRRKAINDRLAEARKRRDAASHSGQIVGPEMQQPIIKPKRKLAIPTVPLAHRTQRNQRIRIHQPADQPVRVRKTSLTHQSKIVDAPSIGPKTATRLQQLGIESVGKFVAGQPTKIARALGAKWITPEMIAVWQDEAQLVCDLDSLCDYEAQLLVAIGCRSAEQIAMQEPQILLAAIRALSGTVDGKRILESRPAPRLVEITAWVEDAKGAYPQLEEAA